MNQSQLTDRLPDLLGDALLSQSVERGEVAAGRSKEVCALLRDDPAIRFETLTDEMSPGRRFAVVFYLPAHRHNQRRRLCLRIILST